MTIEQVRDATHKLLSGDPPLPDVVIDFWAQKIIDDGLTHKLAEVVARADRLKARDGRPER